SWAYVHGREVEPGRAMAEMFATGQSDTLVSIARDALTTSTGQRAELDLLMSGALRTYDFRIDRSSSGGVIAVGFDITPSKLAEVSLRDADRRKDEFLATLSHELRNPLTPLRVAFDLARLARDDSQ